MIKTRTFHPIGQGAFYSEDHGDFSVVYDCGVKTTSGRLPKHAPGVVQNAFPENRDVILFISHFDTDHVSCIDELRKRVNITHVIMPLLYEEDKALIIALSKLDQTGPHILEDPHGFFGKETKIITVRPFDSEKESSLPDIYRFSDFTESDSSIYSGIPLVHTDTDWVFVPYNYDHTDRQKEIRERLENLKIDVKKFISDQNYALEQIKTKRKCIACAYNKKFETPAAQKQHEGTYINENSVFLYSGPKANLNLASQDQGKQNNKLFKLKKFLPLHFWLLRQKSSNDIKPETVPRDKQCFEADAKATTIDYAVSFLFYSESGCIYTGDGNLKQVDLDKNYQKYLSFVKTVQIPHHGSKYNFKNDFFFNKNYFCPISVGSNQRKFPDDSVVTELASNGCLYVVVSENKEFKQIFDTKLAEAFWKDEKRLDQVYVLVERKCISNLFS